MKGRANYGMTRILVVSRATALVAAVLLAGCDGAPFDAGELHELESAQQLWNSARPRNYSIEIRLSCFCGNSLADFTRLDIHGDSVIAAHSLTGGADPPVIGWPTVDNVFGYLRDAAGNDDEYIKDVWARYDAQWGFPTEFHVTCQDNVTDCGAVYQLRNLQRLPEAR